MQTFLPYSEFWLSLYCLDNKRLGKQRVEARQIWRTLRGENLGWRHHPAVKMWRGYENALATYYNISLRIWEAKGFCNSMERIEKATGPALAMPHWLGDERLHSSHRANLLRKNPEHYGRFGWEETPRSGYYWPRGKET